MDKVAQALIGAESCICRMDTCPRFTYKSRDCWVHSIER